MKKYRVVRIILVIIGLILSHAMCVHVALEYGYLLMSMKYVTNGTVPISSAPPWVAFLLAIPYLIGIIVVLGSVYFLKSRYKN